VKTIRIALIAGVLAFCVINATAEAPIPATNPPVTITPGETHFAAWTLAWPLLAAVALCGTGCLRKLSRSDAIDPVEFRDALNIWAPFIQKKFATPRELKRFLNRVRFIRATASRTSPQSLGSLDPQDVVFFAAEEIYDGSKKDRLGAESWLKCMTEHTERFGSTPDKNAVLRHAYHDIAARLGSE
jgi:hypothetical protein